MFAKFLSTGAIAGLAVSLLACSGPKETVIQVGPPPAWVDRMPKSDSQICAVGYSGPTLYQQDCLGNAAENARGGLAETISATIKTVTLDISDVRGGTFTRDVYVSVDESTSEAVLQGSEVQAQWMDLMGQRGSPKGCYAMVCIDPSKPIDNMVQKMAKKLPPKTVEQVRANAEAAFEDLEKEEAKREAKQAPPPPVDDKPVDKPADKPADDAADDAGGDAAPEDKPQDQGQAEAGAEGVAS